MANKALKKYYPQDTRADNVHNTWEVMKPFVHFGFKAMVIIGGALISIVKLLPELAEPKAPKSKKDTRVIKI